MYTKTSSIQMRTQKYKHIPKDFHHTCLESMSAVSASLHQTCWCKHTKFRQERVYLMTFLYQRKLPESLGSVKTREPSPISRCWKFTSRIGINSATGWTWEFAYLQFTVILRSLSTVRQKVSLFSTTPAFPFFPKWSFLGVFVTRALC